jgi:hypothetical protein
MSKTMRYCLCGDMTSAPASAHWREVHSEAGHGPATELVAAAARCRRYQQEIFPARRVMFCGRCGHATGGGYGHSSAWCRVTGQMGESHLCCPGSCAQVDGPTMNRNAPCHPAPQDYERWAITTDAAREKRRGR